MGEPELFPPVPGAPPGSAPTGGLPVASLVGGILAWFSTPFVFLVIPTPLCTIAAIVCGHMARSEIRRNPGMAGDGMAIAGLVLGYSIVACIVLAVAAILLFFGGLAAFVAYIKANGG